MNVADLIGFIGVSIILLALFLNLTNALTAKSFCFVVLNLLGSGIACFSSILLNNPPLIILEGIWAGIFLLALINFKQKESEKKPYPYNSEQETFSSQLSKTFRT